MISYRGSASQNGSCSSRHGIAVAREGSLTRHAVTTTAVEVINMGSATCRGNTTVDPVKGEGGGCSWTDESPALGAVRRRCAADDRNTLAGGSSDAARLLVGVSDAVKARTNFSSAILANAAASRPPTAGLPLGAATCTNVVTAK